MGLEDFKRRVVGNAIMSSVGLLEKAIDICRDLGKPPEAPDVLADDIFPVALAAGNDEVCLYVISVSPTFWPAGASLAEAEVRKLSEYIRSKMNAETRAAEPL